MPGPRRSLRSTPRSTPMKGFSAARRLESCDDAGGETSDSTDDNNATVVNAVVHAPPIPSPQMPAWTDDAPSAGALAARTDPHDDRAPARVSTARLVTAQPDAVPNPTELLMQQLHVANARIASLRREADTYREQNIVLGTSMACFEARELERSLADFEAFERRAQASIGPPVSPGSVQQRDGAQPDASTMAGHNPMARSTGVNSHAMYSYLPPPRSALASIPQVCMPTPPEPHVTGPLTVSHRQPTTPLSTYAQNVPTATRMHEHSEGPHAPSSYVVTPATPSPNVPPPPLAQTYRPSTPALYSSAWPAQQHNAGQIPVRAEGTQPSPVSGAQAHDPLTLSLLEEVRRLRAHIEQQDERSRGCSSGTQLTLNTAAHPVTANDAAPLHTLSIDETVPLRPHDPTRRSAYFDHWRAHELPTFSGVVEDWPMFADAYWSSTERFGYSEYENMQRLRKALTGEAHQRVRSLLMNERHVTSVMQSLEMQFGRPDLLVRSQIDAVRSIVPITDRNIERLSSFAADVLNLSVFLDTAATQQHLANPALMDELILKLPSSRQYDWVVHSSGIRPYPTVKDLASWLSTVARMVSLLPRAPNNQPTLKQPAKGKHVMLQLDQAEAKIAAPASTNPFSPNCGFCSKTHRIADCQSFRALTPTERMREATSRRWCVACMRPGHKASWCRHKRDCGIDNCAQVHHPLLHETESVSHSTPAPGAKSEPTHNRQSSVVTTTRNACKVSSEPHPNPAPVTPTASGPPTRSEPNVLYRMLPVTLFGYGGRQINTYALLDNGSAFTMLDADVARELQLAGPMIEHAVQFCDGSGTRETSMLLDVTISSSTNQDKRFNMSNVRTTRNLKLPTQSIQRVDLVERYPHLRDLPLHDYKNAVPKMLIGLPHVSLTEPLQTVGGANSNGPIATLTELGWVVFGPRACPNGERQSVVMHCCQVSDSTETRIDDIIRDYFTTENFGVKKPERALESDEETRARRMLETTTLRVGARFETGLLWRRDDTQLPDSYPMALRRLKGIECKMRRDTEFARLYDGHIRAYVAKGYARKLTRSEADARGPRTWYLPHFGVLNPNKPGKFRMVFDAAAEVGGTSLNSVLSTGPDQNQPLTTVLFQFRLGPVAICGDIREMFHQVRVRFEDQDSQRFLWRHGTANIEPDTYVMEVMTFGATCSPASAQFVKNKNASEFEHAFPEAAQAIRTRHYVDDYVASFATEEEAIRVTMEVVDVHKQGGFELRGFVSNRPLVLAAVGEEPQRPQPTTLPTEPGATDKILGMQWDTSEDTFLFAMNFHRANPDVLSGRKLPTKRQLLSVAMSVFDPFGILADFLVHTKLMVQELWKTSVGWDEMVPTHVAEWWQAWLSEMERTKLCRVPRCYSPHIYAASEVQLHIFADASESAFAAVAYWRVTHGGRHSASFIIGKTKCAPLKLLTVPRLELQAAVLATRLHCTIRESHDVRIGQVVMWTDSMTVLRWVQSDQRRFRPFVAHRVAEVLDGVGSGCWRWLPTVDNVADDGTRAKSKPRFDPESRWIRGPAFLQHDEADWPGTSVAAPRPEEDEEEIRARFVGVQAPLIALISLTRFSKFERIRRTMGYVLRFVHNCATASGRRQGRKNGGLTATELSAAEKALCRLAQIDAYPEEYHALEDGHKISKHSPILSLMPYLDGEGVLRLFGRTDAASEEHLPLEMKRPILLPKTHSLTTLVARYFHDKMRHTSEDGTMGAIRQRFWIPHLRTLVRRTKRDCLTCRIRGAEPVAPIMGQLPMDRVTPYVRPFQFTGVDYFGPVFVTVGRRREKRWVALFTCLTIRAVHLELAADLTADACLVCIRNFCNTRGVPLRMRSDNGTNFIGANNEIRRSRDFFDDETIKSALAEKGIDWVFNCPGNPEAGGAWERLVQSVKRVLVVTLKETAPRVETLRSLLLEAGNLVNSRPLTHVPVSPTDEEPLTPNHFLLGHNNSTMLSSPDDEQATCLRKQWRISQQLAKRFWVRWVKEYLPELTRRTKPQRDSTPLKVGDLVLVCDSGQARGQWRRGRVTRVIVGTDGRVRTAELRTADGTLCRPVSKLAVLDVFGESPVESSHGGRDVVA